MNKIEWCDYTINPVKGLCPMACSYCYARAMYKRFKWNPEIRWEPEALLDLATMPEGSKVFIGSTFELFHPSVEQHMYYILDCVRRTRWQTSIFLTKQPQNLAGWNFPDNAWVGVSVTDRYQAHMASHYFPYIEAKVKFISFEPLLDDVMQALYCWNIIHHANWVIIGQQTPIRSATTPKIEWVKEIVEACDKARIPVFLKDNLKPVISSQCNMNDTWAAKEWVQCKYPVLRQEFPK